MTSETASVVGSQIVNLFYLGILTNIRMSYIDELFDAFKAGTKGSRTAWKNFNTNTLRNLNPTQYRAVSRAMGDAISTDTTLLKRFVGVVDDDTLTAVLKNSDPSVAQNLVKNMDSATLARVAKMDPGLARSLNFSNVKIPSVADTVIRQGGTTAQATRVSNGASAMQTSQSALNAGKTKTVTLDTAKGAPVAATDDAAEATTITWVRNQGGVVTSVPDSELASAIRNGGDIAENSGTVRTALEKLGIIAIGSDIASFTRKNWMKMGAAMVVLCMMYDTNNPFTALDRALGDVDDMVDGLKELAESAANAAKNTAKGGFDLIAFLTQNWWMSLICCLAIVFIGVAATLS
jgi:hypothetical protein